MEGAVLAAIITGAVALVAMLVTPPITNLFSKKRDHEEDWRKKKLERYIEFFAAFSGAAVTGSDSTKKQRYHEAKGNLLLVAPPNVLIALRAFEDGLESEDFAGDPSKWDREFNLLIGAMRKVCHPKPPNDSPDFIFVKSTDPPSRARAGKN